MVTLPLCAAILVTGFPSGRARAGTPPSGVVGEQPGTLKHDHFLRDAVPVVAHASEPPDSSDDEFLLPEEQDNKKLLRDITVFVIASTFIAYFIIKVFIEKDNEPEKKPPTGKPVPAVF